MAPRFLGLLMGWALARAALFMVSDNYLSLPPGEEMSLGSNALMITLVQPEQIFRWPVLVVGVFLAARWVLGVSAHHTVRT